MMFAVDSPPVSSVMKDKCIALELNRWAFKFLNFSRIKFSVDALVQGFSNFVRPRPGKFFFYKKRALSQQIYS